jgi:hypothetical protein
VGFVGDLLVPIIMRSVIFFWVVGLLGLQQAASSTRFWENCLFLEVAWVCGGACAKASGYLDSEWRRTVGVVRWNADSRR